MYRTSTISIHVKAKARTVERKSEIKKAISLLYARKCKPQPSLSWFVGRTPRKVYNAVPSAVRVNYLKEKAGEFRYLRMAIRLR